MLPKVKEAFLKEKAYQEEVETTCKAEVDGFSNFIFVNRFGNVQHQGTLNKALKRIIRDCNYELLDKSSGKESEAKIFQLDLRAAKAKGIDWGQPESIDPGSLGKPWIHQAYRG